MEISKYFIYFILILKFLFLIVYVYYTLMHFIGYDKEKLKNLYKKKMVLHQSFLLCSYVLMVLLFNPYNNNIILDKSKTESHQLQIIIFAVAIIQLSGFNYDILLNIPEIML